MYPPHQKWSLHFFCHKINENADDDGIVYTTLLDCNAHKGSYRQIHVDNIWSATLDKIHTKKWFTSETVIYQWFQYSFNPINLWAFVAKLGTFINCLITGSGIEDCIETIYPECSVEHNMSGKYHSRAFWFHFSFMLYYVHNIS